MLIGNDTQMSPSFVGQNVCRNDASIARNAKCTFFMTNARDGRCKTTNLIITIT